MIEEEERKEDVSVKLTKKSMEERSKILLIFGAHFHFILEEFDPSKLWSLCRTATR